MKKNTHIIVAIFFVGVAFLLSSIMMITSPVVVLPNSFSAKTHITQRNVKNSVVAQVMESKDGVDEIKLLNGDSNKPIGCPFEEKNNRIIIDRTQRGSLPYKEIALHANDSISNIGAHEIILEPGVFTVSVATYRALIPDTFYDERWYFTLQQKNGNTIFVSEPVRDIRDDESLIIERLQDEVVVKDGVTHITFHHAAYPDKDAHTVAPLCVAFDAEETFVPSLKYDTSSTTFVYNNDTTYKKGVIVAQTIEADTDTPFYNMWYMFALFFSLITLMLFQYKRT